MRLLFFVFFFIGSVMVVRAQDEIKPRPLTLEEYTLAKTFNIIDLDKDTYVKFENKYVLDRYEMRKPYFITGDDGLKKRIDLYKLISKNDKQELATFVFYTNEKGKVFKAVVPDFTADASVWEKYFADIHAINKIEDNFILKLSYVLSKELSFQHYKALNQGKDISKESATYGNDICFPGDQLVTLRSGRKKELKDINSGDEVVVLNPTSKQTKIVQVQELAQHEAKNYAIAKLVLILVKERSFNHILLSSKIIEATPNHPMLTSLGQKAMGDVERGDFILCYNQQIADYDMYEVFDKELYRGVRQKVYNIVASEGDAFIMNDVMVLQK